MVKIYSTPSCAYCETLKKFLSSKGISFTDIDVSKDDKELDEMIKKSDQVGVPVIDIDGNIVIGFDKEKICKLLNIKE